MIDVDHPSKNTVVENNERKENVRVSGGGGGGVSKIPSKSDFVNKLMPDRDELIHQPDAGIIVNNNNNNDKEIASTASLQQLPPPKKRIQEKPAAPVVSHNVTYRKSLDTFGACILIQDDTIRLLEWLAYHYTVLPLGTLYVAIDPKSKRTDTIERILAKWDHRIDITVLKNDAWITLGEEEGWGRPIFVSGDSGPYRPWFKRKKSRSYWSQEHKRRQNFLCYFCQKVMKERGKSYILITDSDEFLLYNYPKSDEDPTRYDALDAFHSKEYWDVKRTWAEPYRQALPTMKERVTIMDYLSAHQHEFKDDKNLRPKCIRMPHLQFSAQDDNSTTTRKPALPPGIDPSHLLTLRQIHHGNKTGDFSKAILNVQITPDPWIDFDNVLNVHLPNRLMCGRVGGTGSGADYMSHLFRLNHYRAGTLESYVERADDYRGASMERFLEERNVEGVGTDMDVRGWIQWFYDKVGGAEEAKRLLVNPLEKAYAHFSKEAQVLVNEYNVFNRGKGSDHNFTSPADLLQWVSYESLARLDKAKDNQDDDAVVTTREQDPNRPTMSACLLLNEDDTEWLPEWLAYHYTVLPLRHLTIGVEAKEAKSLPKIRKIVEGWNKYMEIKLQDKEHAWMAGATIDPLTHAFPKTSNLFYSKCMEEIRQQQQQQQQSGTSSEWTVLVSVQDFVVFNYKHDAHQERAFRHLEGMKLEEIEAMRAKYTPLRDQLPRLSQQVTIAEVLQATGESEACLRIPELKFLDEVAISAAKAVNDKLKGLHTVMDHRKGDMFGTTTKTIVNLAKKDGSVRDSFYSLANPSTVLCGTQRLEGGTDYIGSLLRYHRYGFSSAKDIPGMSRKINVDSVRWVPWFVESVGEDADKLLFDWLQSGEKL